ncbi:hypothetical protein CR105_24475 [Massilia eurypsychrophila]|uniref:Uncharacterized protein n=1 Tax=Massilia eurypsychrophila TaxID=1485217 RepID=A0A2G8T8F6_9BURK|nr:hypothetical protein [Massilia eurypsychrophila]PIL42346.1 hypothetical protein CR105_24475 [Massilia eurypsychrophila]
MDATLASTTFDIKISGMQPTITREIKFKSGDSITFTVTLDRDDEVKMLELHKRSVKHVIALLEAWSSPK